MARPRWSIDKEPKHIRGLFRVLEDKFQHRKEVIAKIDADLRREREERLRVADFEVGQAVADLMANGGRKALITRATGLTSSGSVDYWLEVAKRFAPDMETIAETVGSVIRVVDVSETVRLGGDPGSEQETVKVVKFVEDGVEYLLEPIGATNWQLTNLKDNTITTLGRGTLTQARIDEVLNLVEGEKL